MAISYRKGNINDCMTITELWDLMCRTEENCGEDKYDEILIDSKEVLMNPKKAMFIAFDGDKAVGFSHVLIRYEWFLTESKDGSPVGYLDTIYARPEYRRQGIARTLVKMCEDWSRKKGCIEFASNCDLDNGRSLAFHLGIGFKELHRSIHFSKEL
jgi:aminoglycoside 6'-N-acetyltransferase I